MGVVRVNDQGHAQGLETAPGQFRPMGAGRRRQAAAEDVGEVHSPLLDDLTVGDHPGPTTATARTGPGVFDEARPPVFGFQGSTDTVLQVKQVGFHGLGAGSHGITLNRAKLLGTADGR